MQQAESWKAPMNKWPRDIMSEKIAFYGDPTDHVKGGESAKWRSRIEERIKPPFQMFYEHKPLGSIACHEKVAEALMAAFQEIWEKAGHDHKIIDKWGISEFGGIFNYRKIAGSNSLSNHSFGCAIDLSPTHNGFNTGHGTMVIEVVHAFERQGARWGGNYRGRTDPMHFEFVSPA